MRRSPTVAFWFTFLSACDCSLSDEAFDLAGDGAVDCGHFEVMELASEGHACTVEAFREQKPFVLRLEQQGTDSHVANAMVGRRDGRVFGVDYDGHPGGGGGDGRPKIQRHECLGPKVVTVGEQDASLMQNKRALAGDEVIVCSGDGPWTTICD